MVPDFIAWSVPFASGLAGIFVGLKVGIAKLEVNYQNLREKVNLNREKLEVQVGKPDCEMLRRDCQGRIEKSLLRLEAQVEANRNYVGDRFKEVANELKSLGLSIARLETQRNLKKEG